MKRNFLHAVLLVLLAAGGVLLAGCTIAPSFDSMRYGEDRPVNTDMKLGSGPDGDQPPDGYLTEITSDLIRIQNKARVTAVPADVQALIGGEPEPYRLGPGDVLTITVFDHPELVFSGLPPVGGVDVSSVAPAPGFIVNNAGNLSFPYAGTLKASGLTVQELEDTLMQRLSKVFKNPQLSVGVASFRSKRAYIDGEVRNPGLLVFTDIAMTLPEAINRAGGLTTITGDRSNHRR